MSELSLRAAPRTTCVVFLWFLLFCTASSITFENNSSTDYAALIAFKSKLILKPDNILSTNWTSNTHYCTWFGIKCFNHRVTILSLPELALGGELSPQITNLTQLEVLELQSNGLGGFLPNELGSLQQLRILRLYNNSLQGSMPANLSRCQRLQRLDLGDNLITGSIPPELGRLANLELLNLANKLTEYNLDGHASTKGDVYSFGILLLETFTKKRPTDDMFNQDLSLHQWVSEEFPEGLIGVLDSNLFPNSSSFNENNTARINREHKQIEQTLVPIIRVALLCLKEVPEDRIEMKAIVPQLKKIRVGLKKRTTNRTTTLPRP